MKPVDGMLIQFKAANHRSLREEQTLSLVASAVEAEDLRLIHVDGFGERLLPVAAIYGANASGKSNVVHALKWAAEAVLGSQRLWQPDGPIPREAFALGGAGALPSLYEVDIILSGVRHRYGFSLDDQSIKEEWLFVWPHGRRQELFRREEQTFTFGKNLTGENRAIQGLTRPNSLFLSAAAQNNHAQLTPIYSWFSRRLRDVRLGSLGGRAIVRPALSRWWSRFAPAAKLPPGDQREQVQALLTSADLGILDFKVSEDPAEEDRVGAAPPLVRRRIFFQHRTEGEDAWLSLEQESTGTLALVHMIPALLEVVEHGGLLVIDELNSLHPMLALEIVRLFCDPKRNPAGAQLLFNTHDTTLLGNLFDPSPLRRDQIWFTEKDQAGATHLYPLTDYHPRQAENLERGYLQGRYGAVPFLGPFDLSSAKEKGG